MTALTAFCRDLGPRVALGGALLMSACQHDSSVTFDDSQLIAPNAGATSNTAGSAADAGATSQGATSAGGSKASAGSASGGTASGGAAGSPAGGTGGTGGNTSGSGGQAGANGGAMGKAGQGGSGGAGGTTAGMAGMGGAKNPGPVTIEITDIADTDVSSCMTSAHGEEKTINVDGDESCVVYSLINASLQGIPDGAVVTQATLTLDCVNAGDPATVYFVNESWSEASVRWSNRPDVGAVVGTVSCDTRGAVTIDLKVAVKAWLGGDHAAYGIYLRMETTDGIDFSTSEADKEADRPTLKIIYNAPAK